MQKLRFKNRGGILYFGFGDKFKSSKLKYSTINKNIIIGKFKSGNLAEDLSFVSVDAPLITTLLEEVMSEKENSLKHNSILSYRTACNTSIIPYFKNKFVSDIKPIDIKLFQDSMLKRGLKRVSVSLYFGFILALHTFYHTRYGHQCSSGGTRILGLFL